MFKLIQLVLCTYYMPYTTCKEILTLNQNRFVLKKQYKIAMTKLLMTKTVIT